MYAEHILVIFLSNRDWHLAGGQLKMMGSQIQPFTWTCFYLGIMTQQEKHLYQRLSNCALQSSLRELWESGMKGISERKGGRDDQVRLYFPNSLLSIKTAQILSFCVHFLVEYTWTKNSPLKMFEILYYRSSQHKATAVFCSHEINDSC